MLTDKLGVPDLVLLETLTEQAIYDNLKKRFEGNSIYTYIGDVLVSVNPYKQLDIYKEKDIQSYRNRYMYEMPPHLFALADDTFRSLLASKENQCVIISGESGAGKTEASKIFMNYIASVSGGEGGGVARVKEDLIMSNPILEAFGNAKTLRNDNSSRFGKYMEIQFDYSGAPVGGNITIYLLEKTRVVQRHHGERSFHIFYQLLKGATDAQLAELHLIRNPSHYKYLAQSGTYTVDGMDDAREFATVVKALKTLGFSELEINSVWRTLAAILHIGQVEFSQDAKTRAAEGGQIHTVHVSNPEASNMAADLLQVHAGLLPNSFIFRSISTGVNKRASSIMVPLDMEGAVFSRDALAKSMYDRLFTWLVTRINQEIVTRKTRGAKTISIGLLDIYGFEVFENNSFEQFCINLVNEKLQQVFIELTLKSEQEEYVREGIQWEPVQYFNNKVICDLIEARPMGIIALCDEACLISSSTDESFLDKMNQNFGSHAHFQTFQTTKDMKIKVSDFRLKHYAGDVTYSVLGFLNKNKDTLFRDLVIAMRSSQMALMLELFPPPPDDSKKRPDTCGTQFRAAVNELVLTLLACQPHYVRCIKPNDLKKANVLDEERTRHQVRYLGLLENVRVRRAGFANRQEYERFLRRYKMVCDATWPVFSRSARDGCEALLKFKHVPESEYRLGKTKIFIRNPVTLFSYEDARAARMPYILSFMQACWKGYKARVGYHKTKAAVRLQAHYRGHKAKSEWALRKATTKVQLSWRTYLARKYIHQLHRAFAGAKTYPYGKTVKWPQHSSILRKASEYLRKIWYQWWAHMMVSKLSKEEVALIRQKIFACSIFKGKKPWCPFRGYEADYLEQPALNPKHQLYLDAMQALFHQYKDSGVFFADTVTKLSHKFKPQPRIMVVTESNIYMQDPVKFKVTKPGRPLADVLKLRLTGGQDSCVVVCLKPPSPDLVVDVSMSGFEKVSELVTVLSEMVQRLTGQPLAVEFGSDISFNTMRSVKAPGKDAKLLCQEDAKMTVVKGMSMSVLKKVKNDMVCYFPPNQLDTLIANSMPKKQ